MQWNCNPVGALHALILKVFFAWFYLSIMSFYWRINQTYSQISRISCLLIFFISILILSNVCMYVKKKTEIWGVFMSTNNKHIFVLWKQWEKSVGEEGVLDMHILKNYRYLQQWTRCKTLHKIVKLVKFVTAWCRFP